jgi:phosphoribosyl-ATP pyrophosphohydrolase/phosphoribosyl-AMP cyclohydrolase
MPEGSYTTGCSRVVSTDGPKGSEEAVELVIEAKDDNEELFLNEAADLMYHYIVLLTPRATALEMSPGAESRHS